MTDADMITIQVYWAEADKFLEQQVEPGATLESWLEGRVTVMMLTAPVVVRHTEPFGPGRARSVRRPVGPEEVVELDYVFKDGDHLFPGADWLLWDPDDKEDEPTTSPSPTMMLARGMSSVVGVVGVRDDVVFLLVFLLDMTWFDP